MKCSGRFAFATAAILTSTTWVGCNAPATESSVAQLAPTKQEISVAATAQPQPQTHEVHKEVAPVEETGVPQVFLTADHSALCRVRVGDQLPAITLPQLTGGLTELASLQGGKATVVLFWQDDLWMSETALKDMSADIALSDDVTVVGIAVKQEDSDIQTTLNESGAKFPQLLDNDGKTFNQVGMVKLPRVYVLDATGKIVWFDIEYSEGTRRELKRTLAELTASK